MATEGAHQAPAGDFSLLLQLPDTAKEAMVKRLDQAGRKQLRLACKATLVLVDTCVTELSFTLRAPLLQPRRFPCLKRLEFNLVPYNMAMRPRYKQAALQLNLAARMPPDPWLSVTTLLLHGLSEADTACVVSRCPNVTELLLFSVAVQGEEERPHMGDTISRVCSSLPCLASYCGLGWNLLRDEELVELAGCPRLTSLTCCLAV